VQRGISFGQAEMKPRIASGAVSIKCKLLDWKEADTDAGVGLSLAAVTAAVECENDDGT